MAPKKPLKVYTQKPPIGLPDPEGQTGEDAIARLIRAQQEKPDSHTAQAWVDAGSIAWEHERAAQIGRKDGGRNSGLARRVARGLADYAIQKLANRLLKEGTVTRDMLVSMISARPIPLLDRTTGEQVVDSSGRQKTITRREPVVREALQRAGILPAKKSRKKTNSVQSVRKKAN